MSTTTLPTPADLTITPRDRKFDRGQLDARLWHGGSVEATAIYNALSTTFPVGEAFFVESVRAFREGAPPKLAEEIKGFTTQEAIHSREHAAFNRRAADSGYDLTELEKQVEFRLAITKNKPPIVRNMPGRIHRYQSSFDQAVKPVTPSCRISSSAPAVRSTTKLRVT